MEVAILSSAELEAWLEGKPRQWALAIALRCALRVWPLVVDPGRWQDGLIDTDVAKQVLRAISVSLAVGQIHSDNALRLASLAAVGSAGTAAASAHDVADTAAIAATFAARETAAAAHQGVAHLDAAGSAFSYAYYASAAAADSTAAASIAMFGSGDATWREISIDCTRLQDGIAPAALVAQPLWDLRPEWFVQAWGRAAQWLSRPEHGFTIWRGWYFGRLEGLPHAFDRFDAAADEVFYRWVIEQDDVWWKRDPATVNADIAAKVEELRRPAPPSDEELAQNPAVINFALDGEGHTVLAPEPLPNGLEDDPDARDTHGEILRLISDARLSCDPGLTQATDMLSPVDLLAEAIGQSVADLRPRLFVLRGKELIRQFEERRRPDSMASPLSVGQTNCFAPLIAAVMQLADEDPKLRKLWQGPDGGAPALSKVQITILVDALAAVGQTTPEAQQPLATAAGQVRPDASPDDPARRTTSEMIRNVFRSIGKRIKCVDNKSQAAIGFFDRMQDIWERVRSVLPEDDLIARILDFFKGGGG